MMGSLFLSALVVLPLSLPQDPKGKPAPGPAPGKVDQSRVDAAIEKGVAYLKALADYEPGKKCRREELVLLTLVDAGVPESDPVLQKLLQTVTTTALEKTYNVSLQAMILEELDRVKYQGRILQCAQFLVDNICENGQWSYGEPTLFAENIPLPVDPGVASEVKGKPKTREFDPAARGGARTKPPVVRTIPVKARRPPGRKTGDNSNAQYAALGLRACHDAGIVLPIPVIRSARKWWYESQHPAKDKSSGYPAEGWSYKGKDNYQPYGSMTAGAVGALVIYNHILKENWKLDASVAKGMSWIAGNFTVSENPGPADDHGDGTNHFYYLYALERLGVLAGTELFGTREWYPEGVNVMLPAQKPDGSWKVDDRLCDTCFAILFLRRATRPLIDVPSVDRFHKR